MSWFTEQACAYGLLLVGFLGVEAQRQRRGGSLPIRARVVHIASGGSLLGWPFVLVVAAHDQMTDGEMLAAMVTPSGLMILFCVHLAVRDSWEERCERRERE